MNQYPGSIIILIVSPATYGCRWLQYYRQPSNIKLQLKKLTTSYPESQKKKKKKIQNQDEK